MPSEKKIDKEMEKKYEKGTIGLRSKAPFDELKKIPYTLGELRPKVVKALYVEADSQGDLEREIFQ